MNETVKLASLNNEEVALLEALNDSPKTIEALRKVLLVGIMSNGVAKHGIAYNPMYNWAIQVASAKGTTNEQVGETTRAVAEGITALQLAFEELLHFKKVEEKPAKQNPAI